jgi:hypothetical protein
MRTEEEFDKFINGQFTKFNLGVMHPNELLHAFRQLRFDAYSAGKADGFAEAVKDKERIDLLGEGLLLGSDGRITATNIEALLDCDLSKGIRAAIDSLKPTPDKPQQKEGT